MTPPRIASVCVFCGSSPGVRPAYRDAAAALGRALAERGVHLVYGGAHVGLMGVVADAALAAGGRVTGVIPAALAERELAHAGLTQLHVVDSMHERKSLMAAAADAFVALPGGWGTFEEIFEAVTWTQLRIHAKPCGLLNVDGYFDSLVTFLDRAVDEGFMRPDARALLSVHTSPTSLLETFARFEPPSGEKWQKPGRALGS